MLLNMTESEIRDLFAPETGAVILDTETTGLHDDAEIIELAIISAATARFSTTSASTPTAQ